MSENYVEHGIALDYDAAQRLDNPETLKHIVCETGAHSETTYRTVAELQANAAAAVKNGKR